MNKQNWFPTLHQALDSEQLLGTWDCTDNVSYGSTFRWYYEKDGINYFACIYRESDGMYERPVHYQTLRRN